MSALSRGSRPKTQTRVTKRWATGIQNTALSLSFDWWNVRFSQEKATFSNTVIGRIYYEGEILTCRVRLQKDTLNLCVICCFSLKKLLLCKLDLTVIFLTDVLRCLKILAERIWNHIKAVPHHSAQWTILFFLTTWLLDSAWKFKKKRRYCIILGIWWQDS